jgi:hypothetical protein
MIWDTIGGKSRLNFFRKHKMINLLWIIPGFVAIFLIVSIIVGYSNSESFKDNAW